MENMIAMVYGYEGCSYCDKAKSLLDQEKIEYLFYQVGDTVEMRRAWLDGRGYTDPMLRTFPKIFLRDVTTQITSEVGGYSELEEMILGQ